MYLYNQTVALNTITLTSIGGHSSPLLSDIVSINKLTLILKNYQSVFNTDKNNNISLEVLDIHYH